MAALFERDKAKLEKRIVAAQRAIEAVQRKTANTVTLHERQSLDDALFSLQALATCLLTTPKLAERIEAA
jgi:hypothetical protein